MNTSSAVYLRFKDPDPHEGGPMMCLVEIPDQKNPIPCPFAVLVPEENCWGCRRFGQRLELKHGRFIRLDICRLRLPRLIVLATVPATPGMRRGD
jgi:hypothetical protein